MPSHAPDLVGPFRIVRVLGEGGMSVVYLAERDDLFAQRVAIKILHPEVSLLLGDQPLRHEQSILTSLDHPGIVRLLDRGNYAANSHYIVMEYVDGLPLLEYCEQNHPTTSGRLSLLLEIFHAVDYAHRHLIIHGDLKPQNILVTAEGRPRLLDFGVATLLHQPSQPQAVSVLHTPAFASPEQLAGGRLTPACDVYSLGKVAGAVLPEPLASADLRAVLGKATRADPAERYNSLRDFATDLEAILEHRPVAARRPSPGYLLNRWVRRNRTAASMAALVLLALAASVFGVAIQAARAAHQRSLAEQRLHDLVRLTGTLEGDLYNSVAPLAQAEPARAALVRSATGSLDKLAAQSAGDSTLALEIAEQYRRLASLPVPDADLDRTKALALLDRIPAHDANFPAARTLISHLQPH